MRSALAVAEVVVFPDVEDALRLQLLADLPTHGITAAVHAGQKPTPLPASMVYIRRTGSARASLVVDLAQLTVECYATTGAQAERLAAIVRGLLDSYERTGAMGLATVHAVSEYAGAYLDPDPLAPERFRYTATYQVAIRGAAL